MELLVRLAACTVIVDQIRQMKVLLVITTLNSRIPASSRLVLGSTAPAQDSLSQQKARQPDFDCLTAQTTVGWRS